MQRTFSVLLPLSVIIMVIGGMMGFMGLLARAYLLLMMTGLLLVLGSLITMAGAGVYMAYSASESLEGLHVQFGWSLAVTWVSGAAELLASLAFLVACHVVTWRGEEHVF